LIRNVPAIYQSFAALAALVCALAAWSVFELFIGRLSVRASLSRTAAGAEVVMAVSTVFALVVATVAGSALPRLTIQPPQAAFGIGLTLLVLGVGLRLVAVHQLGAYYTLSLGVQVGQRVLTRGLYRWVRHPGYAGTLLAILGIGFALGTWASVFSVQLVLPALAARIRGEERLLSTAFGSAYVEYCAVTRWRLVPGVI
jgi:protein-S-isoprenylcysteine O-methyltransferase Ste14